MQVVDMQGVLCLFVEGCDDEAGLRATVYV